MLRVNEYYFYHLAATVHPLTEMRSESKTTDVSFDLHRARNWFHWLLKGNPVPLRVCIPAVQRLLSAISTVLPEEFPSTVPEERELSYDAFSISEAAKDFETVLAAELQALDTYFISQKGIYSTSDLIERADMALDESVRNTISKEALQDFKEAGRCLAFDLPTAAGFHAMRAAEAVLREYHQVVKSLPAISTKIEMKQCIDELKAAGADPKTVAVLDQIRDLHRNPLMHPEVFLTAEDGLRLFDIAKSAISAMSDQISVLSSVGKAAAAH